jgi:hypothetical protein
MSTREKTSMWKWLSEGKPQGAQLVRIENTAINGMPDVVGAFGDPFWVELKVGKLSVKTGKVTIKLTPEQAQWAINWTRSGMRSWIFVKVDGQGRFLVSGYAAKHLLKPIELVALDQLSAISPTALPIQVISKMGGKS